METFGDVGVEQHDQNGESSLSGLGLYFDAAPATLPPTQLYEASSEPQSGPDGIEDNIESNDSDLEEEAEVDRGIHSDIPPHQIHLQFQKVIAELRAISVQPPDVEEDKGLDVDNGVDVNAQHESCSDGDISVETEESEIDDYMGRLGDVNGEGWREVAESLLEQSIKQENQAQRLRLLAEELLEVALLRRTLSGVLGRKFHEGSDKRDINGDVGEKRETDYVGEA